MNSAAFDLSSLLQSLPFHCVCVWGGGGGYLSEWVAMCECACGWLCLCKNSDVITTKSFAYSRVPKLYLIFMCTCTGKMYRVIGLACQFVDKNKHFE